MSRSSKVPGARNTPSARQIPDHPPLTPLIEVPVESNPEDFITPENSPPSSTATPLSSSVFGSGSLPYTKYSPYSPYRPTPKLPPRPPLGNKILRAFGKWDNVVNTPTYYRSDSEFWSSRNQGYPEVEASSSAATLNSTRGEVTSPEGEDISPTIEDFLERQVEVKEYTMDPATNQILAAEVSKLEEIRDKVEYKVSRLSPEKIMFTS